MVSLRANGRPEEALTKSTFLVAVESIQAKMERKGADGDDAGGAGGGGEAHEDNEHEGNTADEIEFTWEGPNASDMPGTKTVKMSEMCEDVRESVQKITMEARMQMRAQVQLVPLVKHDEHGNEVAYAGGLLAEIFKTTAHKTKPVANKYVIFTTRS